jgi:DNA (cytosine-5)-methyltransferase 1
MKTTDTYTPPIAMCLNGGGMNRIDGESETFVACAVQEDSQNGIILSDAAGSLRSNAPGTQPCGTLAMVAHSLRADGFDASEDGTGRGTPLVPVAFSCKDSGADSGELALTLRSMGHDGSHANAGGQLAIAFDPRFVRNGRGAPDEITAPLKAESGRAGKGDGATCVATQMAVRRLTPRECERLQGFPDDYTAIMVKGKPAADGPRYKALGNSMAVPCIRWIGERIEMVESMK